MQGRCPARKGEANDQDCVRPRQHRDEGGGGRKLGHVGADRGRGAPRRRPARQGRPACRRDGQAHGAQRQGQVHRSGRRDRRHHLVGQDERPHDPQSFRVAQGRFPRAPRRTSTPLSPATVRRLAARAPRRGAGRHRIRLAQPVHPHLALSPHRGRARGFRGRIYDHRPAELPRRPGEARHAERNGDRGQFHREADPDRRHAICRRDEEVGVRHLELSAPGKGRDADALFGQHWRERRHRRLLRPFGHRQDDAVGRRLAHADRRRRARIPRSSISRAAAMPR